MFPSELKCFPATKVSKALALPEVRPYRPASLYASVVPNYELVRQIVRAWFDWNEVCEDLNVKISFGDDKNIHSFHNQNLFKELIAIHPTRNLLIKQIFKQACLRKIIKIEDLPNLLKYIFLQYRIITKFKIKQFMNVWNFENFLKTTKTKGLHYKKRRLGTGHTKKQTNTKSAYIFNQTKKEKACLCDF